MVPHLVTALNGPINELEQRILESMPAIERWFRLEWMEHTPAFYASADVRNVGFKLAPVDTNLYPDGWNHLSPDMLPLAVQAAMAAIEKICPEAKNLLLVPENHLHNTFYLSNLARLARIFNLAGLNVRLGSLSNDVKEATTLALPDGDSITLEPLIRTRHRLGLKDFDPCTILLNNDLSVGVPGILEDLHEQYLLPPLHAGWSTRRKSNHAKAYEEIAKRFAKMLGMDHWLINPAHAAVDDVSWTDGRGLDELQTQVDAVLTKTRRKYKEYGIHEKPFAVVKPDNGTNGLGLLTVRDAKEVAGWATGPAAARLAKRQHGHAVGPLMVQEGVLTNERLNDAVAEPVVYMMDRYVVGGFYRVHADRGVDESLSAPGASFVPLAFDQSAHLPQPGMKPGASAPNRFYMYGVVGRLAMLAASYEMEATDPEVEISQ
jgi:glutamate--cysteine ligase